MKMKFTKMHGIGNDYVYMDCTRERLENPGEIARLVSDRHKGIGSDGLILIQSSDEADFEMIKKFIAARRQSILDNAYSKWACSNKHYHNE